MAKQKPIDLSVFDEAIKSSPSKKIDLSVFDEAVKPASVEKKNPFQTVLPTGTKPSKLGFEPFEKKVPTETPSVLLSDEQKQQIEQEGIGKRFETTLLNIPTEFGRVGGAMKAAKQIKKTLPETPELRKYGEIPRMQPTAMTEGQLLGESLTKGADFQELTTDKFTGKKTGLQKQIENAQDAFRTVQGEDVYGEIQDAQQLSDMSPERIEAERERKGNYAKFLYNEFLSGTGSVVSGIVDTALAIDKGMPSASPLSKSGLMLDYYRKNYAKGVRNFLKDSIGAEVDKGLEAKYNENFYTQALGGLASSAPAMLTAIPTMGGSMFAQMYDGALESIESQPDADKWDNDTKTIFAGTLGGIQAKLEKYGLDKIIKGGNQLTNAIFRKILKYSKGKNVTGDALNELIDENVKGVARTFAKGGVRAVDGFMSEFYTGAGQEVAAISLEGLFDKATGKPIFNTSDKRDWIGYVERIAKAGGQEGIGGLILGGGAGLLSATSKKKVKENQNVINQIDRQLANPNTQPEVAEVLLQRKADTQANIDDVVDAEADTQSNMSSKDFVKSQELSKQIDIIDLALQDPNTGDSVKADLESQKKAIESEINDIIKKKPPIVPPATGGAMMEEKVEPVAKPTFDTEESLIEEGKKAEEEYKKTGDQVTYEQKIKELEEREKNLVPAPEAEVILAQQVEQLRADEQQELIEAIPNAEQYIVDGKVDRDKITDAEDLKKFDEIYDKYDKLITPLLPKKAIKPTKPKEDAIQVETAGQVPVQPEATVSEEVVKGKPEAKPKVIAKESKEEVKSNVVKDINEKIKNYTNENKKEVIDTESLFSKEPANAPVEVFSLDESKIPSLPLEQFDIKDLIPTQETVELKTLHGLSKVLDPSLVNESIVVFKKDGKPYLLNGHHRVVLAMLNGKTKIESRVFDFNEQVKPEGVTKEGKEEVVAEEDVYKGIIDKEFSKIGTLSLDKIPTEKIVESDNPRKNRSRHNEIMKTVAKLNKLIKCK